MRAIALALCLLARVAAAEESPISYTALASAKPGSWARYTLTLKDQVQRFKIRYAVVEKSDKGLVLEIESQSPLGQTLARTWYEATPTAFKVTRIRVRQGDAPPKDLPLEMLQASTIKKGESPGKLVGAEPLTTEAGKFSCKHFQKKPGSTAPPGSVLDMWMSDKVLPTGLVKMSDGEHTLQFVLDAMGDGATANPNLK